LLFRFEIANGYLSKSRTNSVAITSIGMTMKSTTGIDHKDMNVVTIVDITISPPGFANAAPFQRFMG